MEIDTVSATVLTGTNLRQTSLLDILPLMGVLFMPATLLVAWILAIFGVSATSGSDEDFAVNAMRWMMFVPVGGMFIASSFMHTVLAKKTAANIGWKTNGFQYELGFVSLGIGIAGLVAASMDTDAWIIMSIIVSVFLLGAAGYHIVEMVRDKNFKPGNSIVLLADFGLPISLWALLFAMGAF